MPRPRRRHLWLLLPLVAVALLWVWPHVLPHTPLRRGQTEAVKVWLAAAGALLALCFHLSRRFLEPRGHRLPGRLLQGLLALAVVAAFQNYSRYDPSYVWVKRVDTYDLCHYYLASKYFDELGYFHLYKAIILADIETGGPHFRIQPPRFLAQDEHDYYFVDYLQWLHDDQDHDRIRALFSPQRWESFKHDFTYLQRKLKGLTDDTWNQMLQDHGFNGSPAWVVWAGRPLASIVPVEHVKLLGYTDVAWLLAAAAATWWAFGPTGGLFLALFLLTTYSTRWPTFSWAFGRYDYACALVVAVALVKRGRHLLGGAAAGLAAALRIFPAVWMWGPFCKGLWLRLRRPAAAGQPRRRFLDRRLLRLGVGFVAMLGLLELGVVAREGPGPVLHHFENMIAHTSAENLSSMREGFALAAAYRGETDQQRIDGARRRRVARQSRWRTPLAVLLVLALGWGLRRADDHEALAMGFIPFFLLASASYYYYVVRGTLVAAHSGGLDRARHGLGLTALFAIEAVTNALQVHLPKYRVIHIGWLGWMLTAYSLSMIAAYLWAARRAPAAELP